MIFHRQTSRSFLKFPGGVGKAIVGTKSCWNITVWKVPFLLTILYKHSCLKHFKTFLRGFLSRWLGYGRFSRGQFGFVTDVPIKELLILVQSIQTVEPGLLTLYQLLAFWHQIGFIWWNVLFWADQPMISVVCKDPFNTLSAVLGAIHLLGKYLSEIAQVNHIPETSISSILALKRDLGHCLWC